MKPSPPTPVVQPGDSPAPRWLSRGVYFFRWGLALFLALNLFLGLGGCASTPSQNWRSATHFFSREQLAVMLAANSSFKRVHPEQIDRIQGWSLKNIVALNFNTPELCGASGCRVAIYPQDKPTQPVFTAYLDFHLPPGTSLLEATDQSLNGYPCFSLHQLSATQLKRFTLCYTQPKYTVINQVDVAVQDQKL